MYKKRLITLSIQIMIFSTSLFLISGTKAQLPSVYLRSTTNLSFPVCTDSNSPAHWSGNTFYLFNSCGWPQRSNGSNISNLSNTQSVSFDSTPNGGIWIECTWKDTDGTLYGWYHNEPTGLCNGKTAPRIGACKSTNDGLNWQNLGLVLEAPTGSNNCSTQNYYFVGGNGDFSIMLDSTSQYFYFFFSNYPSDTTEQGIGIARMAYSDKTSPVGKVWKWYNGVWTEPGVGGHVTPIFSVTNDWHSLNPNAFWGPSIHWNTHLNQYVILLNRAINPNWGQEGIYVSFNPSLSNPTGWSTHSKIRNGGNWYPQVIGINTTQKETDKLAGQVARYFESGQSSYAIYFLNPGDPLPPSPINFEDRSDGSLNGQYGGIDWGQNIWAVGGAWAGINSQNVFINTGSSNPTTGRFSSGSSGSFLLESLRTTANALNPWTLTLTDNNGQSTILSIPANTPTTITTGRTLPSNWVDIYSGTGWNAVFDDFVIDFSTRITDFKLYGERGGEK